MQPLRTTELDLRFTGALPPALLLLLVPLLLALLWWLYRHQWRDIPFPRAVGLLILRACVGVLTLLLIFRPDLVYREVLTWPGRIVVLVDNSASMTVPDPAAPETEALYLARSLDPDLRPRQAHDRAAALVAAADELRRFEGFSRDTDRARDEFWAESERVQSRTTSLLEDAGRPDLPPVLAPLFSGERHPGGRAFADTLAPLLAAAQEERARQAAEDREALAADDAPRRAAAAAVRSRPRLALARAAAARLPPQVNGQHLQPLPLLGNATDAFAPAPGDTPLAARLQALLDDRQKFPLSGVVLVSDGRDTEHPHPPAGLVEALAQRQVPVFTCAAGGRDEPPDVAILDVHAPPVAVKDTPFRITLRLKSALPAPVDGRVELLAGDAPLLQQPVRLGERPEQTLDLAPVPTALGRTRFTVRIRVDGVSEVVPERNNRAEFMVHVRDDKVRVLLLDWLPRWETRFAVNILQRLEYVDLNALIVLTRPGARLARGVQKGNWPQDDATLALYDLVLLGDLPPDLLTDAERAALDRWVRERGGTVCQLQAAPANEDAAALRLTPLGAVHPLTRALRAPPAPEPPPDNHSLLLAGDAAAPLVTAAARDRGREAHLHSDRLWHRLNPTRLDGHAALYFELVNWALDGGSGEAVLALDFRAATSRQGVPVHLPTTAAGAWVEACRGEEPVAAVQAAGRLALFAPLPAGNYVFRLRDEAGTRSPPLDVVDEDPELRLLSRHEPWLDGLATGTGGTAGDLADLPRFVNAVPPKAHVERRETVWRLWDLPAVLGVLVLLLTAQWVWRKLEGLV